MKQNKRKSEYMMCFMSNVTRKTDAFTATRGIATRDAGVQAVTNE